MAQEVVLLVKIKYYDTISAGNNRLNIQNKYHCSK